MKDKKTLALKLVPGRLQRNPSVGGERWEWHGCTAVPMGLMDRCLHDGGLSVFSTPPSGYFLFSTLQFYFILKEQMLKVSKCTQEYSQIIPFINGNC